MALRLDQTLIHVASINSSHHLPHLLVPPSFIPDVKLGPAQTMSTDLVTLMECMGCGPSVDLSSALAQNVLTVLSSP